MKDCAHCSRPFAGIASKIRCSRKCNHAAWKLAHPDRLAQHREAEDAKARAAQLVCSYYTGYCACGSALASRVRLPKRCAECIKVTERVRATTFSERAHRVRARITECMGCGITYCVVYGAKRMSRCFECSTEEAAKHRRIHRMKRKALMRGARVENVDPIKVFERDCWQCKGCGVATPKDARGTLRNDAPELDHILALSKGGAHSYSNVQLLCRTCNALKSDATDIPLSRFLMRFTRYHPVSCDASLIRIEPISEGSIAFLKGAGLWEKAGAG